MRSMLSRFIVSSLTVVVALLVELAMVNQGFARCDPYLCSDNPQSRPDHCSNGQRTIGPILRTKNFPAIVWRLPSNDNLREDRPDHNCVCPRDLACHPWYCFYRRAKAVYLDGENLWVHQIKWTCKGDKGRWWRYGNPGEHGEPNDPDNPNNPDDSNEN